MKISRIVNSCQIDSNECWVWQKSCNSAGYGQLTENKLYWLAHRYAYACVNQNLKRTDVVRHQCHNPKCCNPDHLLVGTHKDNWHDSANIHIKAAALRRFSWSINGIDYPTIRAAQKATGICTSSLLKYTINGVFDITAYRQACKIAAWKPKI
jgi:hypothetical protein